MELRDRHAVVTGGTGGIGQALVRRFAEEGARVVVADRERDSAQRIAEEVGGLGVAFDAGTEQGVRALIDEATAWGGPVDVFFSNAGVPGPMGGPDAPDDGWDECWRVNVMQHVWASRVLVPQMVQRGDGYLLNTASAAGLLTQVSAAPYSVTKAGAVSYAEWLSVIYGDAGIKVSCLCPQAVQTPMLDEAMEEPAGAAALRAGGIMDPADVAEVVVQAMREERFLILPHDQVADFMALKASRPDRWLAGMRKIVREAKEAAS